MRDAAGQPSHGFHLLRLPVLDLESPHLREIGGDEQHAGHAARRVVERRGGEAEGNR